MFCRSCLIHPERNPAGSSEHAFTISRRCEKGVLDSTLVSLVALVVSLDGSLNLIFLKYSLMSEASREMLSGLRAGRHALGQIPSCSILSTSALRMILLSRSLWLLTMRPLMKGMRLISTL